ncbi:LysR family transcriptional regulator [Bradyrhizobium sp. Ec3.3]|uniref:LysR family transcriptional regulator n=1 Tax=Bradyrhizobium sp. Ec3.3 TaxID=189753 RepID=UPI001AEBF288
MADEAILTVIRECRIEVEVLRQVVQNGSFASAVSSLDLTASEVEELIARLERLLNARILLHDDGRLALTELGYALYCEALRNRALSRRDEEEAQT